MIITYGYFSLLSWDKNHCPQNELAILMICKFLRKGKGKACKNAKIYKILVTREQTLEMYEIIRVQRWRKNIWTPHMIRSPMVLSFCQLDLSQPSHGIIKTLQDFYEIPFLH